MRPTGWIQSGQVYQPPAAQLAAIHAAQADLDRFNRQIGEMLLRIRHAQQADWNGGVRVDNEDDSEDDPEYVPTHADVVRMRGLALDAQRRLAAARRNQQQ